MGRHVFRVPADYDPDVDYKYGQPPPDGDAYQVWQTTSMAPISPVFPTEEELISWLTRPQHIGLAGKEIAMSEAAARRFIQEGAATIYLSPDGPISGLEALER
jgi:hypothetical protein